MASFFPSVGSWYQELDNSANFEVVAVDEKQGTIEVQYEDGDLTEFDIESWGRLNIITISSKDLESGIGYSSENDIYYNDNSFNDGFSNPLESIEPDSFNGFDELF